MLRVLVGRRERRSRTRASAACATAHLGGRSEGCGVVVSARYAASIRGEPTFLNLDKPYPNQPFTIVIWGQHRAKFAEPPERAYRDKLVCVSGTIEQYRDVPQIVVESPDMIEIDPPPRGSGQRS
jgi:hypothetical protein